MSLTEEERDTMVSLQMEKSKKHVLQADEMYEMGYFDLAANRYYYACFHALHALLIKNGLFCHTHSGLISEFGKQFVRTGKVDVSYGRFVSRLEQLREKSDYNCNYDVDRDDVVDMINPTHELIALIESML